MAEGEKSLDCLTADIGDRSLSFCYKATSYHHHLCVLSINNLPGDRFASLVRRFQSKCDRRERVGITMRIITLAGIAKREKEEFSA